MARQFRQIDLLATLKLARNIACIVVPLFGLMACIPT